MLLTGRAIAPTQKRAWLYRAIGPCKRLLNKLNLSLEHQEQLHGHPLWSCQSSEVLLLQDQTIFKEKGSWKECWLMAQVAAALCCVFHASCLRGTAPPYMNMYYKGEEAEWTWGPIFEAGESFGLNISQTSDLSFVDSVHLWASLCYCTAGSAQGGHNTQTWAHVCRAPAANDSAATAVVCLPDGYSVVHEMVLPRKPKRANKRCAATKPTGTEEPAAKEARFEGKPVARQCRSPTPIVAWADFVAQGEPPTPLKVASKPTGLPPPECVLRMLSSDPQR